MSTIYFYGLLCGIASFARVFSTRAKVSKSAIYVLVTSFFVEFSFALLLFIKVDVDPTQRALIFGVVCTLSTQVGFYLSNKFETGKASVGGVKELEERVKTLEKLLTQER